MEVRSIEELTVIATEVRKDIIRMLGAAGSGHPGGSLSAADIVTALYFRVMRGDPANPQWPDRDRCVLSKGHAVPVIYAAMAQAGYFPREELMTLRQMGSRLQGHPDMRRLPGLEACTGSLGQGLSIGAGIALAGRLNRQAYRTYVILSDGECEEGQTWEAAAFAAFHHLDNLTAILDYNKFQLEGPVKEILDLEPMAEKWRSFNWIVREIDGHNMAQIVETLEWAKTNTGRPTIIIAHTVKGKGVSFMENNNHFHGVSPTPEETTKALAELERA
ncbi:MAG: transketolase [Elusimicrobia bacterium]|nr:transketolase [Elusimicrobiota bacterium]